jgi:hypothetical protein
MKMTQSLTATLLLLGYTITLMPTVTLAQSADGFGGDRDRNPFSRAAAGDTAGLMQFLNQARLNGKAKDSNYAKDQINSATEEFRARQLEALRKSSKKISNTTPKP